MKLNISQSSWRETEKEVVKDVINSRKLTMFSGQYLTKSESEFNSIYPGRKTILLNSGTASLHLALKISGIKCGDEVILPSISYVATALAVKYVGARPVFADINQNNFTIDPKFCESLISRKTKAIIFVHLFGVPGNIEQIYKLCKKYNLVLIEDCAQAFGSKINNRKVGSFGDYSCFSFFESKTISAGEGGALLLSNKYLKLGRKYRHHGFDIITNDRNVDIVGYNYKPSEFESALIYSQLKHSNEIISIRKEITEFIKKQFCDRVLFQEVKSIEDPVIDKLCLIFDNSLKRDLIKKKSRNLGLFQYLKRPLYKEPILKTEFQIKNPVAEDFCSRHLVLQISPYLDVDKISDEINKINFSL